MARPDPISNTYEEIPDEAKELQKKFKSAQGQIPKKRQSRDTLLHDHDWHLKRLYEPGIPPRNLILPPPYPPSRTPTSKGIKLQIEDLRIGTRKHEEFIILRTLTDPYIYAATVTIVEDEFGEVARLTICNLEDSINDPIVTKDSMLLIKQPCWSLLPGGGFQIRVDQPSDLMLLSQDDKLTPDSWRVSEENEIAEDFTKWKKEGDMMFLKKRFRQALKLYNRATVQLRKSGDIVAQIDLCRKRCGVNLVLLRFDDAAKDLSQAISLHATNTPSLSTSQLIDPLVIESWLHDRVIDDPTQIAPSLPRPLKDLAARIKFDLGIYQTTPDYDLQLMSSYVGPLTLHVDAANYTSGTQIKETKTHGRGLFAAQAFKTGDLIIAEKAFALPGYFLNDRSSDCSLYSLENETATDRAGTQLFKELVQKLRHNPSLRKGFFDMDDGGYWNEHGWKIEAEEDIPVDVFRIEHIRRRNCFTAFLRSLDLLTGNHAARNGFWIHTSYINHACLPNSVRTFIGDVLLLRATRDIATGEEITAQYVAPELIIEDRQQKFLGTWGFRCDCHLCAVDENVGQPNEKERMRIFEELKSTAQKLGNRPTVTALKKFAKRLRDLEAVYDDTKYAELPRLCLIHPTLFLTEAWRTLKNVERTIESATKLLKHFGILTQVDGEYFEVTKNSGLVNIEAVRALKYMAEGYDSKGRTELANQIRDVAKVWFRVITGADVGAEEFIRA
ncbi:hypothetical protein BKA66DRAFT_568125 [Pyrenochaeta sp. MPI-SDFR-AT-0127]|nr:hypothetical protein BKA66DRAFT_568125 [Pyrenochaeta sp. MPI-SDFR-AT-0127]